MRLTFPILTIFSIALLAIAEPPPPAQPVDKNKKLKRDALAGNDVFAPVVQAEVPVIEKLKVKRDAKPEPPAPKQPDAE